MATEHQSQARSAAGALSDARPPSATADLRLATASCREARLGKGGRPLRRGRPSALGRFVAPTDRRGITLLEVLVVISLIGMLVGILVPGLNHSRRMAKQTACLAGLQQLGVAICTYAMENNGSIPFGQKPPPPSARNFYTKEGQTTSIVSDLKGRPVGLGLLLKSHLPNSQESLFCPGADERWDTKASLDLVGKDQVESSYYYRHGSISELTPGGGPPPRTKLDRLGNNRKRQPIRTLAMDSQFIAPGKMAMFNLHSRTHHKQRVVNALYSDGHASTHENTNNRFQIQLATWGYQTIDKILSIFEELDTEP